MTAAAVLPHYDAVLALLQAIPNVTGSVGETPVTPGKDPDGKSHGYWTLHPGGGKPVAPHLCGRSEDLDWQFTVTAAAGDVERCLWVRDKVVQALVDVTPTVVGRVSFRIRLDYDVGPPRRYDDPQPPRYAMPLLFTLHTTPA